MLHVRTVQRPARTAADRGGAESGFSYTGLSCEASAGAYSVLRMRAEFFAMRRSRKRSGIRRVATRSAR